MEEFDENRRVFIGHLRSGAAAQSFGEGGYRGFFVASNSETLLAELNDASSGLRVLKAGSPPPKTAFLFPGLGGEAIGRHLEIGGDMPAFSDILDRAEELVRTRLGESLVAFMARCSDDRRHSLGRLRRGRAAVPPTALAHAALYTLECALAALWKSWGIVPDYVCGYSLGEYSAAHVAGCFDFETGLSLVLDRAGMLVDLPPSAMIAVLSPAEFVSAAPGDGVHLVAANFSQQTVLGGEPEAIAAAAVRLRGQGHIVNELPVEYAFHTPLMAAAACRLAAEEIETVPAPADGPRLISTVTGGELEPGHALTAAHWARHLSEPVNFTGALAKLNALGVELFLEVGPGQSLAHMVRQQVGADAALVAATMPSDFDERLAADHLLATAGRLWGAGLPLADIGRAFGSPSVMPSFRDDAGAPSPDSPGITQVLQGIWSKILARPILADDNLFDVGGDSLRTARIALAIKRELGADLSQREIYANPTPSLLGGLIAGQRRTSDADYALLTLPNGLIVKYQSRAEAAYFYKSIFEDRSYLRHGLVLEPGAIILDVGANIGMFSLFASIEAPGCRLYSFEPVPPLFDILSFNMADFSDDAVLVNAGLSDVIGTLPITFYPNSPGMSSFEPDYAEEALVLSKIIGNSRDSAAGEPLGEILLHQEEFLGERLKEAKFDCRIKTISQIVSEEKIEKIDFLKIDVQKFEMNVLRGIGDSDWRRIGQIALEVHDKGGRAAAIRDMLEERGFAVVLEQDPLYRDTGIVNLYARR